MHITLADNAGVFVKVVFAVSILKFQMSKPNQVEINIASRLI